jgi:integrase/recombinase XerD
MQPASPAKKGRRLPKVLTQEDFRRFYAVVDRADDVQHSLMLRLLFYTGVRVSQNSATWKLGRLTSKPARSGSSTAREIRTVTSCLESRLQPPYELISQLTPTTVGCSRPVATPNTATRRVQQIVGFYAEKAGVKATPHTFRHQAITYLTTA